jgi:lactoylglutathione lyase
MQYLHTMVRVTDLDASLAFYCKALGLVEVRRNDYEAGRFTLVFLAAPDDLERARTDQAPLVELTHNWDPEPYDGGRNFGHLAYCVTNIYQTCQQLMEQGIDHRVTGAWPLFARRTTFLSNCYRGAMRWLSKARGVKCQMWANGKKRPDSGNPGFDLHAL